MSRRQRTPLNNGSSSSRERPFFSKFHTLMAVASVLMIGTVARTHHMMWKMATTDPYEVETTRKLLSAEQEEEKQMGGRETLTTDMNETTKTIFTGEKIRTYRSPSRNNNIRSSEPKVLLPNVRDGSTFDCLHWGVVSTIHPPKKSIFRVANLKGWCLVIVGSKETPDIAFKDIVEKHESVHYISQFYQVAQAKANLLKQTQQTRKNIGYLYALTHGAKVIYDFEDTHVLAHLEDGVTTPPPFLYRTDRPLDKRSALIQYIPEPEREIKISRAHLAFNPYPHMIKTKKKGKTSKKKGKMSKKKSKTSKGVVPPPAIAQPRGFPMDPLQNSTFWNVQDVLIGDITYSSIGVIQSLCSGDPHNIRSKEQLKKLKFDTSFQSFPMLVPPSVYAPINAQATTYLHMAFWGLYLPTSVPGRVSDIWRGYISQRIMKDLGLHVMYTPPIVKHEQSTKQATPATVPETDYWIEKTGKLLRHLNDWKSKKTSITERILELWIELYERGYVEMQDIVGIQKWLESLDYIGYTFPKMREHIKPVQQPGLHDQPYRAFPYFKTQKCVKNSREGRRREIPSVTNDAHMPKSAVLKNEGDYGPFEHYLNGTSRLVDGTIGEPDYTIGEIPPLKIDINRPNSAVLKIIFMTMNEWPLMKSWVLYHGHLLGFENLYILDGSTDPRCTSFLRYARDILGANVMATNANLNQLAGVMTTLSRALSRSSDLIMKMDTDEFLVVYDEETKTLSGSISDYLANFANNATHPLRIHGDSKVHWEQDSIPAPDVCSKDIYATPDKFPLTEPYEAMPYYKAVFDSRNCDLKINLGGHAHHVQKFKPTKFGVVHYHYRCVEIEAENCKRVVERHELVEPGVSDELAKKQLAHKLQCPSSEDVCNTCDLAQAAPIRSVHKAQWYLKWMYCPEKVKSEYYAKDPNTGKRNGELIRVIQQSHVLFDL